VTENTSGAANCFLVFNSYMTKLRRVADSSALRVKESYFVDDLVQQDVSISGG